MDHLLTYAGGDADLTSLREGRSMLAAFLHASRRQRRSKAIRTLEEGAGEVGGSFELPGVPRRGSLH